MGERPVLVVTTPTVDLLYGRQVERACNLNGNHVGTLVLQCDEAEKSLGQVQIVCNRALRDAIPRDGVLVALGGGVCSDIVTLAASMIRRGIDHVRIPTTLVSQIDAAIGIKGAVNFRGKKSFLGCFHPPAGVVVDTSTLSTLPGPAISDGIAEMIKMALVRSAELFELLQENVEALVHKRFQSPMGERAIGLSIELMLCELEQNFYERQSYRRLVDFGHTFSPVVEAAHQFSVSHGSAVATDIALSSALSVELGRMRLEAFEAVVDLLQRARLPLLVHQLSVDRCEEALAEARRHRGGSVNLVLPNELGDASFVEYGEAIPTSALAAALNRISRSVTAAEMRA